MQVKKRLIIVLAVAGLSVVVLLGRKTTVLECGDRTFAVKLERDGVKTVDLHNNGVVQTR